MKRLCSRPTPAVWGRVRRLSHPTKTQLPKIQHSLFLPEQRFQPHAPPPLSPHTRAMGLAAGWRRLAGRLAPERTWS